MGKIEVQTPRKPGAPPPAPGGAPKGPATPADKAEELKNKVLNAMEPDNMSIPAKRLMAAFIDLVMIGCLVAFLHIPVMVMVAVLPGFIISLISTLLLIGGGVLVLLKDAPYQIAVLDKQSIGKKVMKLRVVKGAARGPITTADSMSRNFLLALPSFLSAGISLLTLIPFRILVGVVVWILGSGLLIVTLAIYGFEIFTMFKDLEGRRWGDQKAGTMVVLE